MHGGSILSWPLTPTLGDKLQRLATISPRHVRAVELLVDHMLKAAKVAAILAALSAAACGEDRLTVPTPVPSQTIRTTVQLCPDPHDAARGIVCP